MLNLNFDLHHNPNTRIEGGYFAEMVCLEFLKLVKQACLIVDTPHLPEQRPCALSGITIPKKLERKGLIEIRYYCITPN